MFRLGNAVFCIALSALGTLHAEDTTPATPVKDVRNIVGDVLRDQKHIWLSPFRMNRRNAKWWIAAGAATAALIATDKHTIATFENAPTQIRWGNNISRVGAAYTVVPIVGGIYTAGLLTGDSKA